MTAPHIVDRAGLLGEALAEASPDLMRQLLQTMINALLSADADAVWSLSNGVCKGWVSLRKEAPHWRSTSRRVKRAV
ncbi:IS256 family transposase, partial [Microbacterium sp. NPDC003461]